MTSLRVLSLGAGVQSSTLALMIADGEIPAIDCAVFADTKHESKATYRWLDELEGLVPFPIMRESAGDLMQEVLEDAKPEARYLLPVFTSDRSIGRRQCTSHYKLRVIQKAVRRMGATSKDPVTMLIGISLDEIHRMKPSRIGYMRNTFPLIDARMTRLHCLHRLSARGLSVPKSACIFCPFTDSERLGSLEADELETVFKLDDFVRDRGATPGVKQFLSRECKPLRQVDLSALSDHQPDFFGNECEGMCGV